MGTLNLISAIVGGMTIITSCIALSKKDYVAFVTFVGLSVLLITIAFGIY